MKSSLVVAVLAMLAVGAAARAQNRERVGQAAVFDYYMLMLSWSPEFCHGSPDDPQCIGSRRFGFVLHGFWPQYNNGRWPQFCSQAPGLRDVSAMLDIMPSPRLVEHEWERHGTCSGLDARSYFELARRAFASVRIPRRFVAPDNYIVIAPEELKRELERANPDLSDASLAIGCRANYLTEVTVCLSKNLKPVACTATRDCRASRVRMPPVR